MERTPLSIEWVLMSIGTVVTALAGSVVFLFKLHYSDTKSTQDEMKLALVKCEEHHHNTKVELQAILAAEKAECREELSKLSTIIEQKQVQISALQNQVFELARSQAPPAPQPPSSIH